MEHEYAVGVWCEYECGLGVWSLSMDWCTYGVRVLVWIRSMQYGFEVWVMSVE